jgi:hypothetical protein
MQTFLRFARGKEGYATLLCERFGTLRILVKGYLYWEADLGDVLEDVRDRWSEYKDFWSFLGEVKGRNLA